MYMRIRRGCFSNPDRRAYPVVGVKPFSHVEVAARGVVGPGVRVPAGGGQGLVAEGFLHEVNRCTLIQGVRCMGVTEPVWRNGLGASGAFGGALHDKPELFAREMSTFTRSEDGIVWVTISPILFVSS